MPAYAIIPAAGRSARMGRAKLLLPWAGRTLIEHVIDAWRRGGVDARIVVVHPDDMQLADVCRAAGATVCVPATPPTEMKDSVQAGLSLAKQLFEPVDDDAWLLAPADLPLLSASLIGMLMAAYSQSKCPIVAPRLPNGRTGHPVLFSWRLAAAVTEVNGGVKELLERHPVKFVEWQDVDAFADIDTLNEYRHLQNRYDPNRS